jgi:hypothetical protein
MPSGHCLLTHPSICETQPLFLLLNGLFHLGSLAQVEHIILFDLDLLPKHFHVLLILLNLARGSCRIGVPLENEH